jgi:hypothetical protein
MREARQDSRARQGMGDEQGKAGQMRESWQSRFALQGKEDAQ